MIPLRLVLQPAEAFPLSLLGVERGLRVGGAAARRAGPRRFPLLHYKVKVFPVEQNLQRCVLIAARLVECKNDNMLVLTR